MFFLALKKFQQENIFIAQRLFDAAKGANVEYVIGHRIAKLSHTDGLSLKTFRDLGIA